MTYFLLLIVVPAIAWFSGWLAQITQLNFWMIFIPFILVGVLLYRYGPRFFRK